MILPKIKTHTLLGFCAIAATIGLGVCLQLNYEGLAVSAGLLMVGFTCAAGMTWSAQL